MNTVKQLIDKLITPGKKDGGKLTRALKPLYGSQELPKITGELVVDANLAYHELTTIACACGVSFTPTKFQVKAYNQPIDYGCSWACTCKLRHGFVSPFELKATQDKKAVTVKERYGVDNVYQLDDVKLKIGDKLETKFGVRAAMQSPAVRQKASATYQARYGVDWVFSRGSPIRLKIEQLSLQRWGVSHPSFRPEIISKANQTRLERHGHENQGGTVEAKSIALRTNRQRLLSGAPAIIALQGFELMSDITDKLLADGECLANLKHTCGAISLLPLRTSGRILKSCLHCKPVSKPEQEIFQFITSIVPNAKQHNRMLIKPKELDIVVHDKQLAVELNGVYWHKDELGSSTSDKHLLKTEMCEKLGYQLIQVFDHEWYEQQDIIKSLLKARLGLCTKVGGRKLTLLDVPSQDAKLFLEREHLQGYIPASTHIGLYQGSELIMLMSLGLKRFSRNGELEIYRQATKAGTIVLGGLARLLAEVKRRFLGMRLVTFVDRRFFTGKSYFKNGFSLVKRTAPNYWYYKNGKLLNRLQAQHAALPTLLGEGYDMSLTEQNNMEANGWFKLSDCGNLKLEITL